METYHKIQTLFKRHQDGPHKGKMIFGAWTTPELEYLKDNQWEFTEKVDGTNIRIGLTRARSGPGGYQFDMAGRTDRAVIPVPLAENLRSTFLRDQNGRVEQFFMDNPELLEVTLFGEGYGPKIQSGGNYRDDQSFVLFDVKIGDFWLTRENVNDIAAKLGIDSVPVIGVGTLTDAVDIVRDGYTFNDRGGIVRYGSGGLTSKWGNFEAEGIVARPVVPLFNRKGERIITKIKAVDFK